MTPKVRALFDQIEDVLLGFDQDAADVAAIMSAMRGEDGDEFHVFLRKAKTTAPLRAMVFPRLAEIVSVEGVSLCLSFGARNRVMGMADPSNFIEPTDIGGHNRHFNEHIRLAYAAIKRGERK